MAGSPTPPEAVRREHATNDAFAARLAEHTVAARSTDPVRERTRALLEARGLPSGRKLETWKYTDLRAFYDTALIDAGSNRAPKIGFRVPDGRALPAGVAIASTDGRPAPLPPATNARVDLDRYPLAIVNTLLVDDWLTIDVADGVDAGAIELIEDASAAPQCQRVLVRLGVGSRLHLIEAPGATAANRVVEVDVGADASLSHDRYESASAAPLWSLIAVDVGERGHYHGALCAFSAAPRRADVHVKLRGRESHADLLAALGSGGTGQLDVQIVVEHFGAASKSRERCHGLAAQRSQLTFNGRIEIHRGADGADARLDNRNLLLAPTARVNAKPELEIHTRDVRCGHGATVGRLDGAQLFYLRSRGIDHDAARALLTRAFVVECLSEHALSRGLDAHFAALAR